MAQETTVTLDPVLRVDYLRPSRTKVRKRLSWADEEARAALEAFRRQRLRREQVSPR